MAKQEQVLKASKAIWKRKSTKRTQRIRGTTDQCFLVFDEHRCLITLKLSKAVEVSPVLQTRQELGGYKDLAGYDEGLMGPIFKFATPAYGGPYDIPDMWMALHLACVSATAPPEYTITYSTAVYIIAAGEFLSFTPEATGKVLAKLKERLDQSEWLCLLFPPHLSRHLYNTTIFAFCLIYLPR
jgi:hypothetical protein